MLFHLSFSVQLGLAARKAPQRAREGRLPERYVPSRPSNLCLLGPPSKTLSKQEVSACLARSSLPRVPLANYAALSISARSGQATLCEDAVLDSIPKEQKPCCIHDIYGKWTSSPKVPAAAAFNTHLLPGDVVRVVILACDGIDYLSSLDLQQRGEAGRKLDAHGVPEDYGFGYELYMALCDKRAQTQQRCNNPIYGSDIFQSYFKGKRVRWEGRVDRVLSTDGSDPVKVGVLLRDDLEKIKLTFPRAGLPDVAVEPRRGQNIRFEGSLESQGGLFMWHEIHVTRILELSSASEPSSAATLTATRPASVAHPPQAGSEALRVEQLPLSTHSEQSSRMRSRSPRRDTRREMSREQKCIVCFEAPTLAAAPMAPAPTTPTVCPDAPASMSGPKQKTRVELTQEVFQALDAEKSGLLRGKQLMHFAGCIGFDDTAAEWEEEEEKYERLCQDMRLNPAKGLDLHAFLCHLTDEALEEMLGYLRGYMVTKAEPQVIRSVAPSSEDAIRSDQRRAARPGQKRCYTPNTVFKRDKSTFIRADKLLINDTILNKDGDATRVIWAARHAESWRTLVELKTDTHKLLVTDSHRVLVQTDTGPEEVLAENVREGDWVIVGEKAEQKAEQVRVSRRDQEVSVIELSFENDAVVEAWHLPIDGGLNTKGQAIDNIRHGRQECKVESRDADSSYGCQECKVESSDADASDSERVPNVSEPQKRKRRSRRSRRRFDKARTMAAEQTVAAEQWRMRMRQRLLRELTPSPERSWAAHTVIS